MSDVSESELVEEGAIPPDDFHDAIDRTMEVAEWDVEIPVDLSDRLQSFTQHLLLDRALVDEAAAALTVGHLVLQGPPGTGKSSLATALCRAFNASWMPVTAHEDWSTFEVIGRQELRVRPDGTEETVGVNGFFTEAAIRCAGSIVKHFDDPDEPQATWLLIDEMNRAHVDKAFGEVFTVLGTDELVPVTLSHQPVGNNVLVAPRRLRVAATLNSIDKQFVNALSQGIRRRFTFLTLDIPPKRRSGEEWGTSDDSASLASREFTVVNGQASRRAARRLSLVRGATEEALNQIVNDTARSRIATLFDMVERVRYAQQGDAIPFLPVGTAQLIDTVELFLARVWLAGGDEARFDAALDWAASVKIAPLFDTDTVDPADLREFARSLPVPFSQRTREVLEEIAAAGMYYVG